MSIWMGLAHVAGSLVAWLALGVVFSVIDAKVRNGIGARELDMIALRLGVSRDDLDELSGSSAFKMAVLERNSPDLMRNRMSDALGLLSTFVGIFGVLAIIAAVIATAVVTWEDGARGLVISWAVPAITILYLIASLSISAVCYIVTGRAPGQASATRKAIAIENKTQARAA